MNHPGKRLRHRRSAFKDPQHHASERFPSLPAN